MSEIDIVIPCLRDKGLQAVSVHVHGSHGRIAVRCLLIAPWDSRYRIRRGVSPAPPSSPNLCGGMAGRPLENPASGLDQRLRRTKWSIRFLRKYLLGSGESHDAGFRIGRRYPSQNTSFDSQRKKDRLTNCEIESPARKSHCRGVPAPPAAGTGEHEESVSWIGKRSPPA